MKLSYEEFQEIESSYSGYCTNCKTFTRDMTEPDASNYDCPQCNKDTVHGSIYLLINDMVDETSEEDINTIDPIGYAILNQSNKKDLPILTPIEPKIVSLNITTRKHRKELVDNCIQFNAWFALVPFNPHISITHIPTGAAMGGIPSTLYLKTLVTVFSHAFNYIQHNNELLSTDLKTAAKALQPIIEPFNRMIDCWQNSSTEEIVGVFWKDRQAVENELVDLGIPRSLAEKFAFCRTFDN